jgi:hypothetical protein
MGFLAFFALDQAACAGLVTGKFLLFDAEGKDVGTVKASVASGASGLTYKVSLVKSAKLGTFMTHTVLNGFRVEKFKRRPPNIGARSSYMVFRSGKGLRAATKSGGGSDVAKLGFDADVLVIDSRDPADLWMVIAKYGEAGGAVYLTDSGAKVDASLADAGQVTRKLDGRSMTFKAKKLNLGATSALLLYSDDGAPAGAELYGTTAVLESIAKPKDDKPKDKD